MPKVTQKQLEDLVNNGKISGLTLDTTEFHHVGYNYETKSLKALGQFVDTGVKVVISEVVLNEVHSHVRDDIRAKSELVRSGLRQIIKAARLSHDLDEVVASLDIPSDPSQRSKEMLDNYIAGIGAERLTVDEGVTVRQLHDRYFNSQPPFSIKLDKKNEFPDAIALLSLDHWAAESGGYLLAVSTDGDWAKFAEKSDHLICVSQLAGALNLFNRDDDVVASRLAANFANGVANEFRARIERELESAVETFEVEASAPYYYESDDEYAVIDKWIIENGRFDVVSSDSDNVILAFNVLVSATFHASFSFQVHDSIDKDYIAIGGNTAKKSDDFNIQMFVTIPREDSEDDPEIVELESEVTTLSVDFGYVEVDYGDDWVDQDDWNAIP